MKNNTDKVKKEKKTDNNEMKKIRLNILTLLLFYTNIDLLEINNSITMQNPNPTKVPITNPHIVLFLLILKFLSLLYYSLKN